MLELAQTPETPAEQMALEIAKVWDVAGQDAASVLFNSKCREHSLVNWEVSALAHMVTCMVHGKRWKKQ